MKLLKKHGTTIIISLLIGVLLFYLQTPLKLIGDEFINTLNFISNSFSNLYYESVGLNDPNTYESSNNLLLIFVLTIGLFGAIRYLTHEKNKIKEKLSEIQSSINSIKGEIQPTKQEVEISEAEMFTMLKETEERVNLSTKTISKADNLIIMLSIVSLFMVALLYYNYAVMTSVTTENVNFRNDLIKVAPYTDEKEIKTLQAKWTMIKSKADYESIKGDISKLKRTNKIK